MDMIMSSKKKVSIVCIIVFITVISIICIFEVTKPKKVNSNNSVTYQETIYKYRIVEKDNKQKIELMIDSNTKIKNIKLPDGKEEFYNEKSITTSYQIEGKGIYEFHVAYKDDSIKVVQIKINKDENNKSQDNTKHDNEITVKNLKGKLTFSKNINNITNQNVLVSIEDNFNGGYQIEYKIDNGKWSIYKNSIKVDKNCKIYARYTNGTASGSSVSYTVDNIDKDSPQIILNDDSDKSSNNILVKVDVKDDTQTINYYHWSEEANLEEIPKKKKFKSGQEISLSGINGSYYLYIMSTDEAGNRTIKSSDLYNINVDGPEIRVDIDGTDSYVKEVSVVPTITDDNKPITTYYAWSKTRKDVEFKDENKIESGQPIILNSVAGMRYLHIKAKDSLGNETYFKSNIYYIDNISPSIDNVYLRIGNSSLSIRIEATDSYSKSLKYYYSLDNINYIESGNNYIFTGLSKLTEYTLYYKVIDETGNEVIDSKRAMTLNCSYDLGTSFDFSYTGSSQSVARKLGEVCPGEYKIELWGAQGGYRSSSSYGGKGGYATATITLKSLNDLYIYVGASGNTGGTSGGWNGGGSRDSYSGGGGATDIRIVDNGTDWSNTTGLNSRLLVAGGGGSDGAKDRNGGAGGGTTGQSMTQSYGSGGGGGTQTSGGSGGSNNSGTFGRGGTGLYRSNGYGGAGGGGWYGGGGAYPDGSADDDRGGGGGSGFALTSTAAVPSSYLLSANDYLLRDVSLIIGSSSMPDPTGGTMTGRNGDGYARITYLG